MLCGTCQLPAAIRAEAEDRVRRRKESLRSTALWLAEQGHALSRHALARHLRDCLPTSPDGVPQSEASGSMLVALIAADLLDSQPTIGKRIAERLRGEAMYDEAELFMLDPVARAAAARGAFKDDNEPMYELLSARIFAVACGRVLREEFPEASLRIADELDAICADGFSDVLRRDDTAAAFRETSERALATSRSGVGAGSTPVSDLPTQEESP